MTLDGRKLRELVGALCVLALVFLNFGHSAVAAPGSLTLQSFVSAAFCGDPIDSPDTAHVPCHACRIGNAADLPPPPCTAMRIAPVMVELGYAAPNVDIVLPPAPRVAAPRGPPLI